MQQETGKRPSVRVVISVAEAVNEILVKTGRDDGRRQTEKPKSDSEREVFIRQKRADSTVLLRELDGAESHDPLNHVSSPFVLIRVRNLVKIFLAIEILEVGLRNDTKQLAIKETLVPISLFPRVS